MNHYDVYKGLRVKEDELHLNTKVNFYIEDLWDITGKILKQNHNPFNIEENSKVSKAIKEDAMTKTKLDKFLLKDDKNLIMPDRLKFVLFPEDNEPDEYGIETNSGGDRVKQ